MQPRLESVRRSRTRHRMFSDRLKTTLTLTNSEGSCALPAGSILSFRADVQAWGFEAELTFYVSSEQEPDAVFEPFTSSAPLTARFTLGRDVEGETEGASLTLVGPVVERSFSEVVGGGVRGAPVVGREYRLRLADPARVLWALHRPVELLVDASMKDLLQLHTPVGMTLTYDHRALDTKQRVLCLGFTGETEASFYDFVLAWIDRVQGVFELDARTATYRLGSKKGTAGTPVALVREDLGSLTVHLPEPPRFAGRALNPFSLAPVTQALANPLAVQGVRRDVVVHSPVATTLTERAELERARFRPRGPFLRLDYARVPDTVSQPGDRLQVDEGFSDHQFGAGAVHRVIRLRVQGQQDEKASPLLTDEASVYELELEVDAEQQSSAVALLPPFRDPRRVLRVEGKIVSLRGGTSDRSYAPVEDDDDSLWTYKVDLPLFNKVVPVPFAPTLNSGHFFFPAYRGQRVLVDLAWDRAELVGFLDWADEARLPTDSQGNRIVLGFQAANGTVVTHSYVDAKPTLRIERNTADETQVIAINDGEMILSLKEKTLVPSAPPVFNLTAQVEGAKDQVKSEVGGAVNELSATFGAATGKVSTAVEEAAASVEAQVAETERALATQVEEAQALLAELAGGASGAIASVQATVATTRGGLQALLTPDPGLRPPLEVLLTRTELFVQKANGRLRTLRSAIELLGRSLPRAFDGQAEAIEAKVQRARTALGSVVALGGALSAEVRDLLALGLQPLDQAARRLGALGPEVESDVQAANGKLAGLWKPMRSKLRELGESLEVEKEVAVRRLELRASGLRKALASRPDLQKLLPELDGIPSRANELLTVTVGTLTSGLEGAESALGEVEGTAARASQAATEAWRSTHGTALGWVESARSTLRAQGDTVQGGVDRAKKALDELGARADQALRLAGSTARSALETAERLGTEALDQARARVLEGLTPVEALGATAERDVLPALRSALDALEQAEAALEATVGTALTTLDSASAATLGAVGGLVSSFERAQEAADSALQAVKDLIAGLREQIMTPVAALGELLTQVDTLFQTGVNTLTAFIDSGSAALEMIPVQALPKPMVAPTLKAIDGALQAVLPLVATAAQQAGKQLGTLAGTLLQQVQTVEQVAVQGLETFTTTVEQQIGAVLPAVRQQLAQVQGQIDAAVSGLGTQLEALLTSAVQSKEQAFSVVRTQLEQAASAATSQLDALDRQLDAGAEQVERTLAEQEALLAEQVRTALAQVNSALDQALLQAEGEIEAGKQRFAAAGDDLRAEARRASQATGAVQERVESALREGRRVLTETLDRLLAQAQEGGRAALARAESTFAGTDPARLVEAALAPLNQALGSVETQLRAR